MSEITSQEFTPKKIAVMGSGAIGMELVSMLRADYPDANIMVWNRESKKGTAAAITWDQKESILRKTHPEAFNSHTGKVVFTNDMGEAMRGADIVEITGGIPRTSPTQPRVELAFSNIEFIDPIARKAGELHRENPNHKVNYVIGTNPIGIMDQHFQEVSQIPHDRIVGLSGELDVARLEQSIRHHLNLGYDEIKGARVIGAHDDTMVGVLSNIKVKRDGQWKPLLSLTEELNKIVRIPNTKGELETRTVLEELQNATTKGGGKISGWKDISDHEAPAAALAYITKNIVLARQGKDSKPVTCSTYVPDNEVYSGQTIVFSKDGSYNLDSNSPPLSSEETASLQASLKASSAALKKFREMIEDNSKVNSIIDTNTTLTQALAERNSKTNNPSINVGDNPIVSSTSLSRG